MLTVLLYCSMYGTVVPGGITSTSTRATPSGGEGGGGGGRGTESLV